MSRNIEHLLSVLALLILFPSSSLGLDRIRLGLSSVSSIHGAMWVTEEKGIFKKHGIEAEVIIIGGGSSRGMSALVAGNDSRVGDEQRHPESHGTTRN